MTVYTVPVLFSLTFAEEPEVTVGGSLLVIEVNVVNEDAIVVPNKFCQVLFKLAVASLIPAISPLAV